MPWELGKVVGLLEEFGEGGGAGRLVGPVGFQGDMGSCGQA